MRRSSCSRHSYQIVRANASAVMISFSYDERALRRRRREQEPRAGTQVAIRVHRTTFQAGRTKLPTSGRQHRTCAMPSVGLPLLHCLQKSLNRVGDRLGVAHCVLNFVTEVGRQCARVVPSVRSSSRKRGRSVCAP
jgi:hypothetical protein